MLIPLKVLVTSAAVALAGMAPVDDAQRLFDQGQFREAARAFRQAAVEQRERGEYPRVALQGVANAAFALGDTRATAAALEELAAAAEKFGDTETQLRSLFHAALLLQEVDDRARIRELVPRLKVLIASPSVPERVRREFSTRLR